jgi:hypothetical protein
MPLPLTFVVSQHKALVRAERELREAADGRVVAMAAELDAARQMAYDQVCSRVRARVRVRVCARMRARSRSLFMEW